ncbi:MAG TPA: BatA domain-containing protein [Bacteroidia bacterium]|nr:BatA domain-containing protein [Bacteroidia bacterium]
MRFTYPEFLFALFALAIPVIIHLFNFRRFKKVLFTNVRFLREIKQDTQSKSRLKHLLILLSRLLAVAFLVLAFAQPYIPQNSLVKRKSSRKISIYIDNSFSMEAVGKEGPLLSVAMKKAHDIAMAFSPSDQFQLLTNNFEAQHQRLLSREEFLLETDRVQAGPAVKSLNEILLRQHDALFSGSGDAESEHLSYILSDFQRSQMVLESAKADSNLRVNLVPLAASIRQNLFIDTCYINTPFIQLNSANDLVVRIKNNGENEVENIPLKLTINGIQKSLASISLHGNALVEAHLSFTISEPGWQSAELSITDYPVTFDDNFYFSFNVRPSIQILSINGQGESPNLNALFGNDPYFIFRNANAVQVDYSSFQNHQLIILNEIDNLSSGLIQELKRYVRQGGELFIIPAPETNLASYSELMEPMGAPVFLSKSMIADKVTKIEKEHILFRDVFEKNKNLPENTDLPLVTSYYVLSKSSKNREESLMRLQNGNTFLGMINYGNGQVFFLAVPLGSEFSNFTRHALFVPVFLKAALTGSSEISAPLVIGKDQEIVYKDSIFPGDNILHLVNSDMKFDIIPEIRRLENSMILSVHDQIKTGGTYDLKAENSIVSKTSFNFDRKESDLSCHSMEDLQSLMRNTAGAGFEVINAEGKELTHALTQMNEGKQLWKICIVMVLVFLACEILLIRYFRS